MNDDEPAVDLAALKAEHRKLDEQIQALTMDGTIDQLELARLKNPIQQIADSSIPDIIA